MPLVAAAFCAYAAGLLTGFGGYLLWGLAAAGVGLLVSGWRRSASHGLLCLTMMGGVVVAESVRREDDACARRVRARGWASALLLTDLTPGRAARAVVEERRCRVALRVSARAGHWEAGSRLRVGGAFARRAAGLQIRDASLRPLGRPGFLARARAWTGARVDRLYGRDAPLARALLLADAEDLDRDLRDRFADAGIVHMLSVSGLHVAIVAGAVRAAVGAAGAGALGAESVALGTTLLFVIFIGAPPPAVRSAGMLVLGASARALQRPASPWGVWAVSSAVPLVDPRLVLDLGWQLSVAGMAGLLASGPLARRLVGAQRGWRRTVFTGMIATTVASATTAPLVAWYFGRVSLAALGTNLAAAPLFGVAQPLLFASLLALPIDWMAVVLADGARATLTAIDFVARAGAATPWAVVRAEPDAVTALLLGVAAIAATVAAAGRWPTRPLLLAACAGACATWRPALVPWSRPLEVHVLDVGQGDALAIRSPRGRWFLMDAGGAWTSGDAGGTVVWPHLRRIGGDVVHLALSHPHLDHIGGAATLLARAGIDTVWDGAFVSTSSAYRDVLRATQSHHAAWRRVVAGDSISFDGVRIDVLAPRRGWVDSLTNPNEASVILRLRYGDASLLLMGDAESGEEAWLVETYGSALRSDILKVGHHGSSTSSSDVLLGLVQPRVGIISVGTGNTYGHPTSSVLRKLDSLGIQVLRTDDDGTIVVSTDGRWIDVSVEGAHWRYDTRW